ncbi:hypothetical protein BU25DRAFT_487518 [Macroventuria anomochaeta]|uniref:Uncharacterized protein n=1 Tax=Macroventuria anomochaeta TaxID=301207 RepID=A0ACB6SF45_9PLEO|nr:uncharacterized protein BU25DRAFT_487518 [Macroventuria anomochaeta]KAF2631934.1 hypothetical protein BU25DRAFT_487518 [Macroventuria anomochaeta]
MGRRPNQLILEYFERGPKLEDASNRYQHTCKSCGEKFPKGRIDSLTNHLVKKCPALPLRDRQRALLQFHELPLPDNMAQTVANAPGPVHNGQKVNLPFTPSKQLSALETLAEVSRQHLDLSGKRPVDQQQQQQQHHQQQQQRGPPSQVHHNAGHGELLDEWIQDDRTDGTDLSGLPHAMDMSSAPALPSMYQFNGPLHHSPTNSPHMGNMPLASSGSMAQMVPSLVMAASAANDLMPLASGMTMDSDLNLSHNGMGFQRPQWPSLQPHPSLDPLLQDHTKDQLLPKDEGSSKFSQARPIAINPNPQTHFTTDFSIHQKPMKPKVRGRFTDSRRREVQEVRKRGACIRCRMLKKPCSGDNPCNTCQNVESARLWKQPCIRTRIAEEFNLYSAGLHGVLAYHATTSAKGQIRLDQTPGRIEASHHPDSGIFSTFTPLKCHQAQAAQNADIDPAIFAAVSTPDLELIDGEDDISGKLDLYMKKIGPHFLQSEDSAFMKTTQQTVSRLALPNQDGLLPKVLELWHYTRILASRNLHWHLFSNPSLPPTLSAPTLSSSDMEDAARFPITTLDHPSSYNLIKMQLMGATEKRAACVARVVMNELERRLLQRQQANPFETFLVAVILLASVERMCWLFRTWEVQVPSEPSHTEPVSKVDEDLASALQPPPLPAMNAQPAPRHPKWPLDKPAAAFSQQGERFSDILNMLLKMRGVPPKPIPRSTDGMLVMWGDDVDVMIREWYEGIAVTTQMLEERANAKFVGEDPAEWELKFVGKIIRGD